MKKTTTTWTCDRCRSQTEHEDDLVDLMIPSIPKGWEYVGMDLLCNDCIVLFKGVMKRFMERGL